MVYFVSPTWREILIKAREEYGDEVIHYCLSYHEELGEDYDWDYFKKIFYYLPPKDRTNKKGLTDAYWKYIKSEKVINNPTLLKQTKDLTVKFPDKVKRGIFPYDYVFVICFFKLIYDDNGHFSFRSEKTKFDVNRLKNELIDLVQDEFAKEDMNYYHNFPYCNLEMMKPIVKGCLGYPISSREREDWTWVDNQFENAGIGFKTIDVSKIQGELWFEEFWESNDFKIKLMNWKRFPF